ncbi:MAG: hypothetical protein RIT28_641 [Pseudomonadota bacterium]
MTYRTIGLLFTLCCGCKEEVCGEGGDFTSPPAEPSDEDDNDWLFSLERINRIELTLSEEATRSLSKDRRINEERFEVPGRLRIDGVDLGEIGVRMRGRLGGFRRLEDKPKLNLDLNQYSDQRPFGLERLSLSSSVNDPSKLKEVMAAHVMALAEVPASRAGYAQLFINGEDYGLYITIEAQDDRWLRRVFDTDEGNLYDGSYTYADWWPRFNDFGLGRDHLFEQQEGFDVGHADITAVSEATLAALEAGRMTDALADAVDLPGLLRQVAADQWLGNIDGYGITVNNYRVWFPPDGGPMRFASWDLDGTLIPTAIEGEALIEPKGNLLAICRLDPDCERDWAESARALADTLDSSDLVDRVNQAALLTDQAVYADPGACDAEAITTGREELMEWIETAGETLREAWEGVE